VRDARGGEGAGRERAVAGLAVARHRLHEEAERGARCPVRERAVPAHAVARAKEARAEDVVGATTRHRLEHAGEAGGVVFAVAVEVDGGGVALVPGDLETAPKRRAEAARDRMRANPHTELSCDLRGGIPRAVVDEQQVDREPARLLRKPRQHRTDSRLLVTRDDDRKTSRTTARGKRPA